METLLRHSGELGYVGVALALAVSMLQSVLPLTGVWRGLHSRLSVSCVRSSFSLPVPAFAPARQPFAEFAFMRRTCTSSLPSIRLRGFSGLWFVLRVQ